MINIFSIILIILIILFLLFFKRNNIKKLLNNKINYSPKNSAKRRKNNISLLKRESIYSLNKTNNYSKLEKKNLSKDMLKLFKGSKRDKLKALDIAEELSDKTTLHILRIGLKDMDPDVVKRSAILIRNFK